MEIPTCGLCGSPYAGDVLMVPLSGSSGAYGQAFGIVRCSLCGLAYTSPRPTESEIGAFYPRQYYPTVPPSINNTTKGFSVKIKKWIREDYYGYPPAHPIGKFAVLRRILLWPEKIRRQLRGRHVLPWVGKGRLLDVGCSGGGNLAIFRAQGWDVYGVDNSQAAIECARKVVGERAQLGDLRTLGFPEQFFDVIHFSHTLEHLFNPLDTLLRARKILTNDGVLVIAVPNTGSFECKIFGRMWTPWDLPRHLYHFDKTTLSLLLQQAGYRVRARRTGIGTAFFMSSFNQFLIHRYGLKRPGWLLQKLVEAFVAKPFCFLAGHLGYGTEIVVTAEKSTKSDCSTLTVEEFPRVPYSRESWHTAVAPYTNCR